jgi:hypothetical protein
MKAILIILIVLIIIFIYMRRKPAPQQVEIVTSVPVRYNEEYDWNEAILRKNVGTDVQDSHRKYAANVRQYSSGTNFTSVDDGNTSAVFTNWRGFSKPYFVEIGDGARQMPSEDIDVTKRFRHIRFN